VIERIEVDERRLRSVVTALEKESDGGELRRDLVQKLEAAVRPALIEAKAAIIAMESRGHEGTVLRERVADRTQMHIKVVGSHPGVEIRAHTTGMPRRFRNAPKRLNASHWRHPVFGNRDVWWVQIGRPGWFDKTIQRHKAEARRAADAALDEMSIRIARRSKG